MKLAAAITLVAATATARADDYCDHVQAVAAAESDLLAAPTVFGAFGYSRHPSISGFDDLADTSGTRVSAGIDYKLVGLLEASAKRGRARAECDRHRALDRLAGAPAYRALEARAKALEAALPEAQQLRTKTEVDVREKLATQQELVAIGLRVDELRALALQARRDLAALPSPTGSLAGAAEAFYAADHELERLEGRLRILRAFDVSLRGGYDRFLDRATETPVFGVVSVGINLGALFASGANDRAASARHHMVRTQRSFAVIDTTTAQLEATVAADAPRIEQLVALIADLDAQMAAADRLGGDDGRRYRRTVWFERVKLDAERQFLLARVAAVREILGR